MRTASPLLRLAVFAALLVVAFAGAALAGAATDPSAPGGGADEAAHDGGGEHGGGHGAAPRDAGASSGEAPGLAVASAGHRLVVEPVRGGPDATLRFGIVDAAGAPVRDFDVEHTKRLHLIVVRRDLTGFQHLHPAMDAAGTWTQRGVDLSAGGTFRVLADFTRAGRKLTLGADVQAAGAFAPRPLPAPARTSTTGAGLDVSLTSPAPRPGREARLTFTVREDGRDVTAELDPYLGARGHLVALREGDLAYLHTHPDGDRLAFGSTAPSAGRYRLFLQVQHRGRVQTAAFTLEVG